MLTWFIPEIRLVAIAIKPFSSHEPLGTAEDEARDHLHPNAVFVVSQNLIESALLRRSARTIGTTARLSQVVSLV